MKELGEITHVVEVLRGKTQHWDSLMCRRADDAKDCIDLIKEMMILWQKDGEPGIEDIEKLTKQSFGLL